MQITAWVMLTASAATATAYASPEATDETALYARDSYDEDFEDHLLRRDLLDLYEEILERRGILSSKLSLNEGSRTIDTDELRSTAGRSKKQNKAVDKEFRGYEKEARRRTNAEVKAAMARGDRTLSAQQLGWKGN